MNDKEAKIILEDIKNSYEYCHKNNLAKRISIDVDYKTSEAIETVLNLIEKQKAEIEDIKIRKERQLNRFSKYKENIENKHEEIYEDLVQEIEKKDNIINNSIIEIEKLRQYFSEDLQVEFIRILEILRDKKVIDW